MATSTTRTRSDLEAFLQEIRAFLGNDWFDKRLEKEGSLDVIAKAHPVIRWWVKVREMLDRTKRHNLNVTPMEEALQIIRLGSCLRVIQGADIVDMNENLLKTSITDLFVSRFRSSVAFLSAFYETLVASAYIRNGYAASFIADDTRRSPEFFVDVNGSKVYVECKRIERRRIDKATDDRMRSVTNQIGQMLLHNKKRLAVFIICPEQRSTVDASIIRHIDNLLRQGQVPSHSKLEGFHFIVTKLPPSRVVWARRGHQQELLTTWIRDVLNPWKRGVLGHADTPIEKYYCRQRLVDRERALWDIDAYVGTVFKEYSNIIGGVGKIIRKASRQLPANGVGLVYIECPPYNASPEEMDEFGRIVIYRLNSTTRTNGIVLTGTQVGLDNIQHISSVLVNEKSARPLPNGFRIVPLNERYVFGPSP
jgi:hypothetical protein